MRRFMGMMSSDEIKLEKSYRDKNNLRITVQAGSNGWTVLWADHSSDYKDVVSTAEENFQAAMNFLADKGFKDLMPINKERMESHGER